VSTEEFLKGYLLSWWEKVTSFHPPFFNVFPVRVRNLSLFHHPESFDFGIREEGKYQLAGGQRPLFIPNLVPLSMDNPCHVIFVMSSFSSCIEHPPLNRVISAENI